MQHRPVLSIVAVAVAAVVAASTMSAAATTPSGAGAPAEVAETTPVLTQLQPGSKAASAPLSLRRGAADITLERFGDDPVYLDLGVYAVAGAEPFEVRATRTSYAKPIRAVVHRASGNLKLPRSSAPNFKGLRGFSRMIIRNKAGKIAADRTFAFCPSEPVRIRPDAPAVSPYPDYCSHGPFNLGAVWGVEAGYATPITGYDSGSVDLKDGRYTVVVRITDTYRQALGIPAKAAKTEVKIRVKTLKYTDCEHGCRTTDDGEPALEPGARPTGPEISAQRAEAGPTPDLRSLPAWGIRVRKGKHIAFSATVWNAGDSPLVVDGFRRKKESIMDAYQYFFNEAGEQIGYDQVGTMEWDPKEDHFHWHFTDFARYSLVDKDKNNVVRSRKEAFCLANTDAVDYTVEGANWKPGNTDLHSACGWETSVAVREVLESGSGDTYEQFRPGQSFRLKGLANGVYFIKVHANPVDNLTESDTTNNVSYRKIRIGGKPGARTVKVPPVGLVKHR